MTGPKTRNSLVYFQLSISSSSRRNKGKLHLIFFVSTNIISAFKLVNFFNFIMDLECQKYFTFFGEPKIWLIEVMNNFCLFLQIIKKFQQMPNFCFNNINFDN